jgi:hypothetical protein
MIGTLMNTRIRRLLAAALLGAALAACSPLNAADAKAKPAGTGNATTEKGKAKRDWYPFYGTVASVDQQGNSVSLKKKAGTRVIRLDAKSQLEISGKAAALGSVQAGAYAHGKLRKDDAGNEVIVSAKFDKERPKKAGETKPEETPTQKAKN